MKSLQGTKTELNILAAFAGESQARNRYDFFASKAKNEGLAQIADMFTETAQQEKEHAKRLFKFLVGGEATITAAFPAGVIGSTEANLRAAAAGENHEHTVMYPDFAKIADAEGFAEIAAVMRNIAVAEAYHERRFLGFAENLKAGRVFARESSVVWHCRNCGCTVEGAKAPDLCPACAHPQAYFEALVNPW
jgi:rubrerythrin